MYHSFPFSRLYILPNLRRSVLFFFNMLSTHCSKTTASWFHFYIKIFHGSWRYIDIGWPHICIILTELMWYCCDFTPKQTVTHTTPITWSWILRCLWTVNIWLPWNSHNNTKLSKNNILPKVVCAKSCVKLLYAYTPFHTCYQRIHKKNRQWRHQ